VVAVWTAAFLQFQRRSLQRALKSLSLLEFETRKASPTRSMETCIWPSPTSPLGDILCLRLVAISKKNCVELLAQRMEDSAPSHANMAKMPPQTFHARIEARRSTMLAIAPEIRAQVYQWMTRLRRGDHLSLLLTCKKIYNEGLPTLFHRPLRCSSQDKLMEFTSQQAEHNLLSIRTLELRLKDIDHRLMEPFLTQVVMNMSPKRHTNPYMVERDRIIESLKKMPNLESVAILKAQAVNKTACKILVDELLTYFGGAHRSLVNLRLDVDNFTIQNLRYFKRLKFLRVNGFSKAPPRQIVDTVKATSELRALQLVGPPTGLKRRSRYLKCQDTMSILTPAAIQQMPALRVLEIFELTDARNPKPALLTSEMLKAICCRHSQSLEDLTISSITSPDENTIAFVFGLLMTATNIYNLALTWPGMTVEMMGSMPGSIRRLELAVSELAQAEALLAQLSAMRHKLPYLTTVQLLLINEVTTACSEIESQKVSPPFPVGIPIPLPAAQTPAAYPWEVKWGVWQPIPVE
jgi:hypothetical protein